ncbi:unnamed protein product [Acanthoscelides obtectus]|uniref:MICOS complex subunit MIC13 n=1 Tax=Acanthoscelides obtectus TaxID=200917 RepID=A0A9P0PV48_ACAOB|nr:unnamed protein product [Acanthoscelides obtectus]CAK1657187.1 hypothetical protein AOBTE_LOCUS20187 [Acanthoscelides obtectus]
MGKPDQKCLNKTNLLVYQTPSGEKQERKAPCVAKVPYRPPICKPTPKTIRVATGKELKRICPPKLCDCGRGPKKPGKGMLGLLGFALKAGLAAAAVYVSYDIGVWGTGDDTMDLYKSYCNLKTDPQKRKEETWKPQSCQQERELFTPAQFDPYQHCGKPPIDLQDKQIKFKQYWNCAVTCVFSAIAGLPNNIINRGSKEKKDETKDQDQQPFCIPYNELPEDEKIENSYR